MREADPALWPMAGKGGGKGASHVESKHLVNLALALAVAEPITTAPKMVPGYRNMLHPGPLYRRPEQIGPLSRLLFPDTIHQEGKHSILRGVLGGEGGLGGDLERLVELMADPDLTDDQRDLLLHPGPEVNMIIGWIMPAAEVSYLDIDLEGRRMAISYTPKLNNSIPRGRDPNWNFAPPQANAPIIRRVTLTARVFAVLAELWNDTLRFRASTRMSAILSQASRDAIKAHRAFANSQPDAPSATPENETAANHPLAGTDAAALGDQPARTELDETAQPHSIGGGEKSQPTPTSQAGRSLQHDRSESNGPDPGDGGAHGAAT